MISPGEDGFEPGVFVIHTQDVLTGQHDQDAKSMTGCCGPTAEMKSMNWLCPRRHAVGGEQTECWLPHGFAFNPTCVYRSDGDGTEFLEGAAEELQTLPARTSRSLARGIASSGSLDGLYALADALEEMGFENKLVLKHLRAGHHHHAGCLVLDWLTG